MNESDLELALAFSTVLAVGNYDRNLNSPLDAAFDEPNPQRNHPVVLLVDDERLIVDTLAEVLEEAGFQVLPAYNGWMALDQVAHCQPDYLLSDVLMPKMNGVELAITIRQKYPSTRIILFSGQAGISEILLDGQRRGFEFELLAKPMHPLKIIEYLKSS